MDAYLVTVARSVGCPDLWLDDCVQEMNIGIWQAPGVAWKTLARRRAIDFMRRLYGRRAQRKYTEDVSELRLADEGMAAVDRVIDYRLALSRLTERQRAVLLGALVSDGRRSQVRKLAREMLVAS